MKRILLLAVLGVFTFASAQAQEIRLGVKGGLNVAALGGDGLGSLSARKSFHIGGLAEIPLSGNFALQPEILYSSEGTEWGGIFGIGSDADLELDYIRVPIMAKYYIIDGLSAEAGPVLGVLVGAKQGSYDAKDDLNTFDAAIAIGATYRLNMGVFFSLRYNKGLLNIWDTDRLETDYKNQNNVFQISVGYSF